MPEIPYPHNTAKPPESPHIKRGTGFVINDIDKRPDLDSAKYILTPDQDFSRPYLAVPGSIAFVWPLGIEGFEIQVVAELGRHRYLGEITLDVDVTHKGETGIILSGVFPGWTATENMNALRQVFEMDTPANGKILSLPGVMPDVQYVVGESIRFAHAEDERLMDIQYTASFVRKGHGASNNSRPSQPDQIPTGSEKGRGTKKFQVNSSYRTLRGIARKVYGSEKRWTELYDIKANAKWFDKRNISSHKAPDYRMPLGTTIYY